MLSIKSKEHRHKYKEIFLIALPAILESLFAVLISSIDTKMIAPLGDETISAVSFTAQPKLIVYSLFFALGTTVSVFVSQSYGEKDKEKGNYYFHSILKLGIILALVLGSLTAIFSYPIMSICSRQTETLGLSSDFYRIIMAGLIFQGTSIILNAALKGTGKTRATFVSNVVAGIIDIIFNYLLIEGNLGFPALGVQGDAIATVMGTIGACCVSLYYVNKKSEFLSLKHFFKNKNIFSSKENRKLIISKAGNVVVENIFTRIAILITSIIISTLPSNTTSVYFVGMLLLNYSMSFGVGFDSAVVALAGKSYGEKNYDKMYDYVKTTRRMGFICSVILCIIFVVGAPWFFGLYFEESAQIQEGFYSACVAGIIAVFQIYRFIDVAALRAMGEMKIPRKIATICVLVLNSGCSFLLGYVFKVGIWGIWISTLTSQIVWFAASHYYCRRKTNDVLGRG